MVFVAIWRATHHSKHAADPTAEKDDEKKPRHCEEHDVELLQTRL